MKSFKCTKCDKSFKRRRLLHFHLYKTHRDKSKAKVMSCVECEFKTIYPSYFNSHKNKHKH